MFTLSPSPLSSSKQISQLAYLSHHYILLLKCKKNNKVTLLNMEVHGADEVTFTRFCNIDMWVIVWFALFSAAFTFPNTCQMPIGAETYKVETISLWNPAYMAIPQFKKSYFILINISTNMTVLNIQKKSLSRKMTICMKNGFHSLETSATCLLGFVFIGHQKKLINLATL